MVFLGEKMTIQKGKNDGEATFKLNARRPPKSIDIVENGKTKVGIYDLPEETWRIRVSEQSEAALTAFAPQPNSSNDVIIMLKRIASADEAKDTNPQ